MTVIIFLIVLAILIFVHELGHFIFARWNGIRVDEFKLGFGPKILAWKRGETEYGVNLIPFGGFVKIHGENPDQESIHGADRARSFVNKNRSQQASVLVAGVLFNFLFAWLIYATLFSTGVTAAADGFEKYAGNFTNSRIMITYIEPKSPAEKANLQIGDVITGINMQGITAPNIEQIQSAINASNGATTTIKYIRGSSTFTAPIRPQTGLVPEKYAVGIAMSVVGDLHLPFFTAIYEGAHYTLLMIRDTAVGLYTFVTSIFQGTADFSQVAGPVGIAGIVGNAAHMGLSYLLMVTALISINLGVINLIPFPALDGGRILFVAIEGLVRRRISPKITNTINAVGFALLMILMVAVTYRDVAKLFV